MTTYSHQTKSFRYLIKQILLVFIFTQLMWPISVCGEEWNFFFISETFTKNFRMWTEYIPILSIQALKYLCSLRYGIHKKGNVEFSFSFVKFN